MHQIENRSSKVKGTLFYTVSMSLCIKCIYSVVFFDVQKLILNKKSFSKNYLRYRGLVFCILLCEVCIFFTYLSFKCGIPGFLVLYSRTKMLKLRKSQTLHQKNPHFWIFLQQWALIIGHFFVMESQNIFVTLSSLPHF